LRLVIDILSVCNFDSYMVLSMSNHLMQASFNTLASLLPTYKALTMAQKIQYLLLARGEL